MIIRVMAKRERRREKDDYKSDNEERKTIIRMIAKRERRL